MTPPLIHVGFPKSASTTLQKSVFKKMDGISFLGGYPISDSKNRQTYRKTSHLIQVVLEQDQLEFETNTENLQTLGQSLCEGLTGRPVISNESLVTGSYSSGKVDRKQIIDRLAKIFPDSEVLIVIRNQLSILKSYYIENIKGDILVSVTFENWLRKQLDRRDYANRLTFFKYDLLIDAYYSVFSSDNVHVLPLELLSKSPRDFCRKLADILGVSSKKIQQQFEKKTNPRPSKRGLIFEYFFQRINSLPIANTIKSLCPERGLKELKKLRRSIQSSGDSINPTYSSEMKRKIKDYYRDTNQRLIQKLGLDVIKKFNYPS